jgi:hypothetical protein
MAAFLGGSGVIGALFLEGFAGALTRLVAALARAAGETRAVVTGEVRWSAAARLSWSVNSVGASACCMCQVT